MGDRTGPARASIRGVALLALTGLAGLVLAIHGWSARGSSNLPGPLAGAPRPGVASHGSGTPASGQSSRPIGPTASPSAPPSTNPSAAPSVGPSLASQSYAQYAFQVWPGTPSASAKAALIGLSISVRRTATGISVIASVVGQQQSPAHVYAGGTKVWVIEASLGDDSGNTDYNLGDDGLIVTNAAGRILQ